jgi:hypothetical protein
VIFRLRATQHGEFPELNKPKLTSLLVLAGTALLALRPGFASQTLDCAGVEESLNFTLES